MSSKQSPVVWFSCSGKNNITCLVACSPFAWSSTETGRSKVSLWTFRTHVTHVTHELHRSFCVTCVSGPMLSWQRPQDERGALDVADVAGTVCGRGRRQLLTHYLMALS